MGTFNRIVYYLTLFMVTTGLLAVLGCTQAPTSAVQEADKVHYRDSTVIDDKVLVNDPKAHLEAGAWDPNGQSFLYYRLTDRTTDEAINPKTGEKYAVGIYEMWLYSVASGQATMLSDNGFAGVWSANGKQVFYFSYNQNGRTVEGKGLNLESGTVADLGESEALWLQANSIGTAFIVKGKELFFKFYNDNTVIPQPSVPMDDPIKGRYYVPRNPTGLLVAQDSPLTLIINRGTKIQITADSNYDHNSIAWSPDSHRFAYTTISPTAELFFCESTSGTANSLFKSTDPKEDLLYPAWAPDNQTISFVRRERGTKITNSLWVVQADGEGLKKLADDISNAYWAPDSKRLVYEKDSKPGNIGVITLQGGKYPPPAGTSTMRDVGLVANAVWLRAGRILAGTITFYNNSPSDITLTGRPAIIIMDASKQFLKITEDPRTLDGLPEQITIQPEQETSVRFVWKNESFLTPGGGSYSLVMTLLENQGSFNMIAPVVGPDGTPRNDFPWWNPSGDPSALIIGGYQSRGLQSVGPVEIPSDWEVYDNWIYGVTLGFPGDWKWQDSGLEKYGGADGFFQISEGGTDIDEGAKSNAFHKLKPFGSHPTIENIQVQGQEARLILPSDDQSPSERGMALALVSLPQQLKIEGWTFSYIYLWADQQHIRRIIDTIRFTPPFESKTHLDSTLTQ